MDEEFARFMLMKLSEYTLRAAELELRKTELEDGLPKLSDLKGTIPDLGIPSMDIVRKVVDVWNEEQQIMSKHAIEWRGCPICGGKMAWDDVEWDSYFLCTECGYCITFEEFDTHAEAVKWWNTRPLEDKLNARITKLEKTIANAKSILEEKMGEWASVEEVYLPLDYLRMRKVLRILEGKES